MTPWVSCVRLYPNYANNNGFIIPKNVSDILYDILVHAGKVAFVCMCVGVGAWLFNPTATGGRASPLLSSQWPDWQVASISFSPSDWSVWSPDTRALQNVCHTMWRVKITRTYKHIYINIIIIPMNRKKMQWHHNITSRTLNKYQLLKQVFLIRLYLIVYNYF